MAANKEYCNICISRSNLTNAPKNRNIFTNHQAQRPQQAPVSLASVKVKQVVQHPLLSVIAPTMQRSRKIIQFYWFLGGKCPTSNLNLFESRFGHTAC